jgi:hypothetical protein
MTSRLCAIQPKTANWRTSDSRQELPFTIYGRRNCRVSSRAVLFVVRARLRKIVLREVLRTPLPGCLDLGPTISRTAVLPHSQLPPLFIRCTTTSAVRTIVEFLVMRDASPADDAFNLCPCRASRFGGKSHEDIKGSPAQKCRALVARAHHPSTSWSGREEAEAHRAVRTMEMLLIRIPRTVNKATSLSSDSRPTRAAPCRVPRPSPPPRIRRCAARRRVS